MRVDNECLVIDAEVLLTGNLDLDLPEALPDGRPATVQIVVNILYADDDEFGEPISAEDRLEGVFPVSRLVDLESTHGLDVNNMNEARDLVDEDHGADSAELLAQRLRKDR